VRDSMAPFPFTMFETLAAAGIIGAVGALWKIAMENVAMRAGFKAGMDAVIHELKSLRAELSKDIKALEDDIKDHEFRLRDLEKKE
jgi:cytochrome c556